MNEILNQLMIGYRNFYDWTTKSVPVRTFIRKKFTGNYLDVHSLKFPFFCEVYARENLKIKGMASWRSSNAQKNLSKYSIDTTESCSSYLIEIHLQEKNTEGSVQSSRHRITPVRRCHVLYIHLCKTELGDVNRDSEAPIIYTHTCRQQMNGNQLKAKLAVKKSTLGLLYTTSWPLISQIVGLMI